jgi:hypothetical protein
LMTLGGRSTNTYPQSPKILSPQLSDNIFQSIMSSRTPSELESNLSNRKIYLIVNNKNIFRLYLVKICNVLRGSSRTIHIQEWLRENNFLPIDKTLNNLSTPFFFQTPHPSSFLGQIINNHKTYRMPMFHIVFSRIS